MDKATDELIAANNVVYTGLGKEAYEQMNRNLRRVLADLVVMLLPAMIKAQQTNGSPLQIQDNKRMNDSIYNRHTIYLLSGLGADYRAFKNLKLPGYHLVYIHWIPPEKKESMEHYASRISSQVTTPDPIIIGLSFGGMIAVELAKQIPVRRLILISSAKTGADLAGGNSFFFTWKLYKVIPGSLLKQSNFIVNNLFGATSSEDKKVLSDILEDSDPRFFRWAMDNIVHWKNETIPPNVIHIHGTHDKIIPYAAVKADYSIEGGGHLMVLNRADTISTIILNYLRQ